MFLLACVAEEPAKLVDSEADAPPPQLEGAALVTRLSLDLRGVRPSSAELQQDPESLLEEWVADPRFGTQVAWIWDEALRTAVWTASFDRFGPLDPALAREMGWEPLSLVEAVVAEDRAFTEVVTSDHFPPSELLPSIYPREGGVYLDGRPAVGLLASTTLWLRYVGTASNHNRVRGHALARSLLCSDFFERDGGFLPEVDPEVLMVPETAVHEEVACLSCHASLDPMSNFLGGFSELSDRVPEQQYMEFSPFQASWARAYIQPVWYGVYVGSLDNLGATIAEDPRFARCAVERLYTGLVGQPPDPETHEALTADFVEQGFRVQPLAASIVRGEAYRSTEPRLLRADQLHSSLEALGLDPPLELAWDAEVRAMGGYSDDDEWTTSASVPGTGTALLQTWTAQRVSPYEGTDLPSAYEAFLGRPPTASSLEGLEALYDEGGWPLVTEALVRHPDVVLH